MALLNYGFDQEGTELFCEAASQGLSNGSAVGNFADQSDFARHLTADSNFPTFQTNIVNSKPVIRNNGLQNPLRNSSVFDINCGWVLVRYNGFAFPSGADGYSGLLTGLNSTDILVGNQGTTNWFDFGYDLYEYRSNDRIYAGNAPAPMNAFKLIFFRFHSNITMNGIQIFQQKSVSNRKFAGDIALIVLCSRNYVEDEIHSRSKSIASAYAVDLADVYPYQSDVDGISETPVQEINFYDPPEGDRISEVLSNPKRILDLQFSSADQEEFQTMKAYHASHYAPAIPCFYRDYKVSPPQDIEGYIDSPYKASGANNNFNYSFRFKEK